MSAYRIYLALPVILLALSGCGNSGATATANTTDSVNHAAVTQFIHQEQDHIQDINKGFVQESNLFKQMSTKQTTYSSFQSSYGTVQSQVQKDITAVANAKAPAGAESYQQAYVSLLKQGLKVFSDQEQAILPNGSVDKPKVSVVEQELKDFVTSSNQVAKQYGVNN